MATSNPTKTRNLRLMITLIAVALGMLGVAYAFVPLYRLFCQTFGIPVPSVLVGEAGQPKNFASPPPGAAVRTITVRFMANQATGVPVLLAPQERRLEVPLGVPALTAYTAQNTAPTPMDGVAVHTLFAMGGPGGVNIEKYIDLQQCFCFEEQHYPGAATVNLPLSFTISPDLPEGIHTITFAYTLFDAGGERSAAPLL